MEPAALGIAHRARNAIAAAIPGNHCALIEPAGIVGRGRVGQMVVNADKRDAARGIAELIVELGSLTLDLAPWLDLAAGDGEELSQCLVALGGSSQGHQGPLRRTVASVGPALQRSVGVRGPSHCRQVTDRDASLGQAAEDRMDRKMPYRVLDADKALLAGQRNDAAVLQQGGRRMMAFPALRGLVELAADAQYVDIAHALTFRPS